MVKRTLGYLAIFLVSLMCFLVAYMPASVAWQRVIAPQVNLNAVGVNVRGLEGTVWEGRAHVFHQYAEGVLSWHIDMSKLFQLRLPIALSLDSNAGTFDAMLSATPSELTLTLPKLDLDVSALNNALAPHKLKGSGELLVRDLTVTASDRKLQSATGKLRWSGGSVRYPAGAQVRSRTMPAMSGELTTAAPGQIAFGLRDQDADFDMLTAELDEAGVAFVQVRRRLLDIAEEPWPANSQETDVVFKVKKPLLPQR